MPILNREEHHQSRAWEDFEETPLFLLFGNRGRVSSHRWKGRFLKIFSSHGTTPLWPKCGIRIPLKSPRYVCPSTGVPEWLTNRSENRGSCYRDFGMVRGSTLRTKRSQALGYRMYLWTKMRVPGETYFLK
jgi:hypothetical protein